MVYLFIKSQLATAAKTLELLVLGFKWLSLSINNDDRGAIGVQLAIMAFPLVLSVGAALDYSMMAVQRTAIQNALDAAMVTTTKSIKGYLDVNGNTSTNVSVAIPIATAEGQASLNAWLATKPGYPAVTLSISASFSNNTIQSEGSASFAYKTTFLGLGGIPTLDNVLSSTSTASVSKFVQIIFLVDASASMGVGATSADVSRLESMYGCQFACHTGPTGTRVGARNAGVKVKFDYAQSAIKSFVKQISDSANGAPGHYYIGLYTFSGYVSENLALTSDFTKINAAIDALDVHLANGTQWCESWGCPGWTYISKAISTVTGKITNIGDGSSPTSLTTYLIFVSDGIYDEDGPGGWWRHNTGTSWYTSCATPKQKGMTVATIQAVYTPFPGRTEYDAMVAPFVTTMGPAFRSCASASNLALSASDGPGMETAIKSLFPILFMTPRLSK